MNRGSHKSRGKSPNKHRTRSPSPSSSSSSETVCEVKCKVNRRRHDSDHSDSDSDRKKHRDKKHNKHKSERSDSESSDCKEKVHFDDIYKYFKWRLVTDKSLMVAGSDAYLNAINNVGSQIPQNFPVEFSNATLAYNIEYPHVGSPFYVREDGVYIVFFITLDDQSNQYSLFVNGVLQPLTTIGTNSGAGQTVCRNMIRLRKDDNVLIRNHISTAASVTSNLYAGGLQAGNDMTYLMAKIAPLDAPDCEYKDVAVYEKCLSKKKRHLFKKLLEKLLCDKELMLKGFNTRGTFYNKVVQDVLTENDVVFSATNNVNNLLWNPTGTNPEQVKILEDGVYKLFFLANTNTAAQFALAVNGTPVDVSIQGTNRGAGQITTRSLLELKKNDIVTVKNHTSANGKIVISQEAGGKYQTVNALLTIFKIAPLCKPQKQECKINDYYRHCYDKFKNYLLSNDKLQIAGSPCYLATTSSVREEVKVNESFEWSTNVVRHHIYHQQGKNQIVIEKDGVYDLFADIITNEPAQLTMFVNDVPDMSTVFGRDSGANRCLLRQFVKLNRGDVLTVRNYESHAGTVNTAVNPGGQAVGQSITFMAFLLSPTWENCANDPPQPPKKDKK